MRWFELYEYLIKQRHNNPDFRWNNHVVVHNIETDDEFVCDTWIIKDSADNDRLVLTRLEDENE
jgi:hypothetical protein|tara:strand:+ start:4190 stop:4381 length:192 start_codon:yes stop_codon:yes gene_type:complete